MAMATATETATATGTGTETAMATATETAMATATETETETAMAMATATETATATGTGTGTETEMATGTGIATPSRLGALLAVTALLAACATANSETAAVGACPTLVHYTAELRERAAREVEQLAEDSAVVELLSDYAAMRAQSRACRQGGAVN